MTKFCFHFKAKSPASINTRLEQQTTPRGMWGFTYANNQNLKIALTDSVTKKNEIWFHEGLDVFIQLQAASAQEAEQEAKGRAEQILSVATLVAQVSCAPSRMMSVITDIENQPSESRFASYLFEGSNLVPPIRKLDETLFRTIFDAYTRSDNGHRISRSISWLRKGLEEDYSTDAFVAYWVGLEVLSGLLRRKLQMRVRNPEKWDGVKDIIEGKTNINNFDQVKDARDNLLHGLNSLDTSFISEIESYRDDMRKALVYAICSLLELPDSVPDQIVQNQPMKLKSVISTVLCGSIEGIPNTFEELTKNYPQTLDSDLGGSTTITETGEIKHSGKYNFRHSGPETAKWNITALEQRGGNDIGISNMDIAVEE